MTHDRSAPRPIRWLLAFAAVALVGSVALPAAQAQDLRDVIHQDQLDNGLDVVVLPDQSVPIVTIELALRHGAFAESEEYDGLAHLYEHMFFKGNEHIPNQQAYMERIRELGMVFNGTTSTERVNYFFTLPAENLSPGLEFMYHATTSPLFDEDEFEREKEVVFGEADRAKSNPQYWLRRAVNNRLWHAHPHRKHPLGEMDVVADATVEQMQHIQDVYYVPNNAVLVIAGDVDIDEAMGYAEEHFGGWERGDDPFEVEPVPENPPLEENSVALVEESVQVPMIQFGWHGPSVDEDPQATHAADVLLYILSQPTSQFQQNLVDSRIALGASKSYFTQRYIGPASLTMQVTPDNVRDAIRAALLEIEALSDPDYFTDEQLESAKTILAANDIFSREKTSSFVRVLTFWWASADLDYYLDYIDDLDAVTRDDIARYVDEYIADEPFVLGVLISEEHRQELGLSEEELQELVEDVQREIEEQRQEASRDESGGETAHLEGGK